MNPDKKSEHARSILQTQSEVNQEEYILHLEEQVDSLEKEVCFCGSLNAFGDTVEKLESFLTFTTIQDLILESIEFIKRSNQS